MAEPIVLVVDDHRDSADGLRFVLEAEGYTVETARNGREALRKLYGGLRPCIIVLDLMMPVMNGFEFREEQLKHPDFARIPVIVCSAVVDLTNAQQTGAAAYFQKPGEMAQILALVREHCLK